jgi:hypothetical protein
MMKFSPFMHKLVGYHMVFYKISEKQSYWNLANFRPQLGVFYGTFCPDTALVARSIHQMTRVINYQNRAWYSFPLFHPVSGPISRMKNRDWYRKIGLDTASRILVQWAHVSDEESLLRESLAPRQNPVYFYWLLDFVMLRGRGQECVGTADVIKSRCLTSGRQTNLALLLENTSLMMPWVASHCLGTTLFIVKESIVNQRQSFIVGLERVETVKTGTRFVDMFYDVSFM